MRYLCVFIALITGIALSTGICLAQDQSTMEEVLEKVRDLETKVETLKSEAKARKKLMITEEEKEQREREILTAVDKEEYTLERERSVGLNYTIAYSYSEDDELILDAADIIEGASQYNHTMKHQIALSYGLRDNLTCSFGVPFVYRYYKMGGRTGSVDVTGIGDMYLGINWQPFKKKRWGFTNTVSSSMTFPTGRSPYKINPNTEISTGSGVYSISAGINMSKPIDPIVVYGGVSYAHSFDFNVQDLDLNVGSLVLQEVEPGDSIGLRMGFAYALSYRSSINLGFSYTYQLSTTYYYNGGRVAETPSDTSASISIGTGWKISPKTTVSMSLGIGLVGDDNFSLTFGIPFSF